MRFDEEDGKLGGLVIKMRHFVHEKLYPNDQKNSVPAAAGAVVTSHTVFLLNRV